MASTYVTTRDDTLWGIAQQNYGDGTFWHVIYDANRELIGPNPGQIQANWQLVIPDLNQPALPPHQHARHHITRPGDTLWSIAEQFYGDGNYWSVIYEANRDTIGTDPGSIFSGKTLTIPDLQNWSPPSNQDSYQPIPERPIVGAISREAPAVVYSWRTREFVVFINAGRSLFQHAGGQWNDLGAPPTGITQSPGAVTRVPDTIHVAVRGGDGHLYQRHWNGAGWSGWENRGGDLASGPTLTSGSPSRLDCFALGMFRNLIHCSWSNDHGWSRWEDLSPTMPDARFDIQFAPAAVAWSDNRLNVFAVRSGSGELLHAWWDGQWHGWERLGGVLTDAPSVVSRGPNLLDVYGRGTDGQIYHLFWDGYRWSSWYNTGRHSASGPAATVGWRQVALFARAYSGTVQRLA
jgi:hypothetical protein